MTRTLSLSDELYNNLAQEAASRGITVESLLAAVSRLMVMPEKPTARDRERSRRIERLFDKDRAGRVTDKDREILDRLIDEDYEAAIARADRLIAAKTSRVGNGANAKSRPSRARPTPNTGKQPRK